MLSIETAGKGIAHIEDLKVDDFINTFRNFNHYDISEKVDGSNIHFGIDSQGFYTSREHAGGKRVYNLHDYPINFSTTFQRSAHVALSAKLPELIAAGLNETHRIEVEVLFGELPNVVPYSNNTNKIVFLRTIAGDMDINSLHKSLGTVVVELPTPNTMDGKTIHIAAEQHTWEFTATPTYPSKHVLPDDVFAKINKRLDDLVEYLLTSLHKEEQLQQIAIAKRDVKEILLNTIVRQAKSEFGDDDGWVEGVVCRHTHTGKQFKVVDKDIFIAAKNFLWEVRDKLNEKPRSLNKIESFVGKFLTGLAESIGHPILGTIQAKRYLKKLGNDNAEIVDKLSSSIDFEQVKLHWIDFVKQQESLLINELHRYKETRNAKAITIELGNQVRTFGYNGEVDKRTLQVFSSLFQLLEKFKQGTSAATSAEDLIMLLIGDKL